MKTSLKIGLSTMIFALGVWFILNVIALGLAMSLRPYLLIVIYITGLIGLIMALISFVADRLKRQNKRYKLVLWVIGELCAVIIIVYVSFIVFLNMPLEEVTNEGLKIKYLDSQNDYSTSDYNAIFYR